MPHILSFFPQILFLAPLSATFLRITVAAAFLYIAYVHMQRRDEIAAARFPLIGHPGILLIWITIILETALALALFLGGYAQVAALAGLVLCTKHFVYAKKYPRAVPLCRLEYALLFVMCLSILVTGAGAFAFDLPL